VDEPNPGTAATRAAAECLTLWLEPGEGARYRAVQRIASLERDLGGPSQLIVGLLHLNMLTLLRLAKKDGATKHDVLQRAYAILRELSPQLPK
jgi:hypothetical protein